MAAAAEMLKALGITPHMAQATEAWLADLFEQTRQRPVE
jgi:hypothetical protein